MIVQRLPPSVEDLNDAGGGAEELLVCGKVEQGIGDDPVKKRIKQGLVRVKDVVEFKRDSKNHMEIGSVYDLRAAVVNPNLPGNGLA